MSFKKHIPNLFTLSNLTCGAVAAILITENHVTTFAAWLIFFAAFFDLLDGAVARALGVSGDLGKQLDSLADVVSFGLVATVIQYKILESLFEPNSSIIYLAFLNVICAAIRLARFNISTDQKHDFNGMPSPANGIFWASVLLCYQWMINNGFAIDNNELKWTIVLLGLVTSFLMVAPIRMFSFKFQSGGMKANLIPYLFILFMLVLSLTFFILFKSIIPAIPACIILYILMSFVYHFRLKAQA